jgi:hypothetical protein
MTSEFSGDLQIFGEFNCSGSRTAPRSYRYATDPSNVSGSERAPGALARFLRQEGEFFSILATIERHGS